MMNDEQKILELQRKIDRLSSDMLQYQQQLSALQQELNSLLGNTTTAGVNEKPKVKGATTGLENFIGLRFMHIAGIVVLVTGLSIGVKYAIDKELISEGMRIALAYGAGLILFALSWVLRKKYQLFSSILFSGSMASGYFTTYAASVYYQFLPGAAAFAIMTALTVYTVFMAIGYNRQEIGVLGMVGAYGIPFLVSANNERAYIFFSYILLINAGVVVISFRKSWKLMQYLALLITWILFAGWAFMKNETGYRWAGTLFLALYFILFVVSAFARSSRTGSSLLPGEIQQVIINNTACYLSAILLFGDGGFELHFGELTGYAVMLVAFMAVVATLLFRSELILQRLLAWQAVILLVLFVGSQWSGVTITLLWLAIAVALFVWGAMTGKSWPRMASILLIGITLGKLVIFDTANFSTVQKIISYLAIGVLLLLFSFYYQRFNVMNRKKQTEE